MIGTGRLGVCVCLVCVCMCVLERRGGVVGRSREQGVDGSVHERRRTSRPHRHNASAACGSLHRVVRLSSADASAGRHQIDDHNS